VAFVLDASICAVWALTDESEPLADRVMARLALEPATVPALWWFEIRNVLIISERRKRLTVDGSREFLKFLGGFPIWSDDEPDEAAIFGFARKYQLSFYDAAYLEVASRKGIALATLDRALRSAAEAAGVALLG
jgi:predicted nucleic acid-binding protein